MKSVKSIVMMGMLLAASGLGLTACSSEDSDLTGGQSSQVQKEQVTLDEALVKVENCMKQVDFSPLAPLAESLSTSNARALSSESDAANSIIDALDALMPLLKPTYAETTWRSTYQRWSFANLDSTLCLTFDLLFELGNKNVQQGEIGLNQRTYTQSLQVKGVNDSIYTITTKVVKQLTTSGLVAENIGTGQLVIYQNEKPLFAIETMRQLNVGVRALKPVNEYVTTGTLRIAGNEFTLGYERTGVKTECRYVTFVQNGSHVLTQKMTMDKDFSWNSSEGLNVTFSGEYELILMGNLAAIKATTTDLKRFYQDGIEMAKAGRYGSSMENCQIIADSFNETTSLQILLAGTNAAQMKIVARQIDVERNLWKPVLVCTSPILGKNEMTIAEIMDAMDITFKDIMDLLLGADK